MTRPVGGTLPVLRRAKAFLLAQLVGSVAAGVSGIALPWLVLDTTESKTAAGLVFATTIVPYVVFGLVAGAVADSRPPRSVLISGYAAQAVAASAIPLWSLWGSPPLLVIFVAAFSIGSARVFVDAAAFPMIAAMAGRELFTRTQAVVGAVWSVGLFLGPAIGGALVGMIGPGRTLVAEAAMFAMASLAVTRIRGAARQLKRSSDRLRIAVGLRFIVRHRFVRRLTGLGALATVATGGITAMLVPLLRDGLDLPSQGVGQVLAGSALGGVIGAAAAGPLHDRFGGPRTLAVSVAAGGLLMVVLTLTHGVVAAAAVSTLSGAVSTIVFAVYTGSRQAAVPDDMQAVVGISGRMLMMTCTVLGASVASGLAGAFSIVSVVQTMGAAGVLVGVAIWILLIGVALPVELGRSDRNGAETP